MNKILAGISLYPVISHLTTIFNLQIFSIFYLAILFLIHIKSIKNKIITIVIMYLLWLLINKLNLVIILIYLPSFMMIALMVVIFGTSLYKNNIPLITRFALIIEKDLSTKKLKYTKKLTKIWLIVLLFILGTSIYLLNFGSIELWSWFINIGSYIILGVVFTIEFFYRKVTFKEDNISFYQFLIKIIKNKHKVLQK